VVAGVLGRAGETGQARRLEDAKDGQVVWQTPTELRTYMKAESRKFEEARRMKAAAARKSTAEAELLGMMDESDALAQKQAAEAGPEIEGTKEEEDV
jgi:hypothetical protein